MYNIPLAINRLENLIDLAASAKSEFEKAAIYAAATTLTMLFQAAADAQSLKVGMDLELIRWGICGSLGYDTQYESGADGGLKVASASLRNLKTRLLL